MIIKLWEGIVLYPCMKDVYEPIGLCPTQVVKRKGEYLFGIAPCLAALQAKRRKVHAIFLKQGGEGNKKRQIKKQVMRYQD